MNDEVTNNTETQENQNEQVENNSESSENLKATAETVKEDSSIEASEETKSSEKEEKEKKEEKTEKKYRSDDYELAAGDSPEFKWYVAHVLTGHENKVCAALKERIYNYKLTENFAEILIPEESVVSHAGGKKRKIKKKYFPGYVLIKMIMSDETWHVVKDTDKVTGFVGANKNKPIPITEEEANFITNQAVEGFKKQRSSVSFAEGDQVKVIEGPFASFVGTVENVNDKGKIRVQVSIFGRPTPVELDFTQVEKVD